MNETIDGGGERVRHEFGFLDLPPPHLQISSSDLQFKIIATPAVDNTSNHTL